MPGERFMHRITLRVGLSLEVLTGISDVVFRINSVAPQHRWYWRGAWVGFQDVSLRTGRRGQGQKLVAPLSRVCVTRQQALASPCLTSVLLDKYPDKATVLMEVTKCLPSHSETCLYPPSSLELRDWTTADRTQMRQILLQATKEQNINFKEDSCSDGWIWWLKHLGVHLCALKDVMCNLMLFYPEKPGILRWTRTIINYILTWISHV